MADSKLVVVVWIEPRCVLRFNFLHLWSGRCKFGPLARLEERKRNKLAVFGGELVAGAGFEPAAFRL